MELYRIADQILHQLFHLVLVGEDRGKGIYIDLRFVLFNLHFQSGKCPSHHGVHVHKNEWFALRFQSILNDLIHCA